MARVGAYLGFSGNRSKQLHQRGRDLLLDETPAPGAKALVPTSAPDHFWMNPGAELGGIGWNPSLLQAISGCPGVPLGVHLQIFRCRSPAPLLILAGQPSRAGGSGGTFAYSPGRQ